MYFSQWILKPAGLVVMVAMAFSATLDPVSAARKSPHTASQKAAKRPFNPFVDPMVFTIVRATDADCEPNCPEWIYAEGQIMPQSVAAFKKILKKVGDRKLPLLISSPGGSVTDALKIGRIIRARKMNVEVAMTHFSDCSPHKAKCAPVKDGFYYGGFALTFGAFCWSACPLILAGGERRLASPYATTGVHQITTSYQKSQVTYREKYEIVNGRKRVVARKIVGRKMVDVKSSTKLPKSTRKALLAYFDEMGIEHGLLDAMLSTPPDRIRRLTNDEMLAFKLVSEVTIPDVFAKPTLCTGLLPAENCVLRDVALASPVGQVGVVKPVVAVVP